MYDALLGKTAFMSLLLGKGFSEEQAEKEWNKLEQLFLVRLITNMYEKLPEKTQSEALDGLDESKTEDVQTFFTRASQYISDHIKELGDVSPVTQKSIKEAYMKYAATI